jgi:hypothetical protein
MGHITDPTLLLVELGFNRSATLQLHPHPAPIARQGNGLQLFTAQLPFESLGALVATGGVDDFAQLGIGTDLLQENRTGYGRTQLQQPFGPGIEETNPIVGGHNQPATWGGL